MAVPPSEGPYHCVCLIRVDSVSTAVHAYVCPANLGIEPACSFIVQTYGTTWWSSTAVQHSNNFCRDMMLSLVAYAVTPPPVPLA